MYEEKQMKNSKKNLKIKVSEDDNKNFEKNIQKLTDRNIENIEKNFYQIKKKKLVRYE